VSEGVAQLSQGGQRSFNRSVNQSHTASEGDLGTERTQRPIRQEEAVTSEGSRGHQGLQQVLQGGIDPGDAHQHRTSATLLEHLQGDATGSVGC
jgi:hypothetical protein